MGDGRFRFSLATLVGVVLAAGVVFGAWRVDERLGILMLTVLSMLAIASASVVGFLGDERARRRWLPFAMFALFYGMSYWTYPISDPPLILVLKVIFATSEFSVVEDQLSLNYGWLTSGLEALGSVLFGFVGMGIFHFYWKRHPPGGDAATSVARPESANGVEQVVRASDSDRATPVADSEHTTSS